MKPSHAPGRYTCVRNAARETKRLVEVLVIVAGIVVAGAGLLLIVAGSR